MRTPEQVSEAIEKVMRRIRIASPILAMGRIVTPPTPDEIKETAELVEDILNFLGSRNPNPANGVRIDAFLFLFSYYLENLEYMVSSGDNTEQENRKYPSPGVN